LRRKKLIVVLLLMTTLTGCIQKFDYSEEQTDTAAEYMAGLMLKYDTTYKAGLVEMKDIVAEQEANATPTPNAIPNSTGDQNTSASDLTDAPKKEYTLTQVIGEEGFDLQYTGYIVADTYPEDATDAYFSIPAREGNQLVVLSFQLKNKLDKKNTLDLTQADITYQLDVNVGTVYEPPFALLENNLKLIDMTLKAKEEKEVILIFEVKKDVVMNNINLMVTRDTKSEIIEIK